MKALIDYLRWRYTGIYWFFCCVRHKYRAGFHPELRKRDTLVNANQIKLHTGGTKKAARIYKDCGILYLIHWFELGGAESFALETIKAAKQMGYATHVFSTVSSANGDYELFSSVADHSGIADVLPDAKAISRYILENNIHVLHIHHSKLAYSALPLIKEYCADLYVIDSTHIIEYPDGGFPNFSARFSDFIDVHHVISLQLAGYIERTYHELHGRVLDSRKIVLAYLLPSPVDRNISRVVAPDEGVVRVLFYGRIENQKQPYLFCRLIRMLNEYSLEKRLGLAFKGVIVGAGSHEALLHHYYTVALRKGELEWLGRIDDKDYVYSLADILVLPSRNEGISLTSYEAIARWLPIVSADVGAQRELLPREMLVDIWQCNPLPEFVSRIVRFAVDDEFRQTAMTRARENLARLAETPADMNWILSLYGEHNDEELSPAKDEYEGKACFL